MSHHCDLLFHQDLNLDCKCQKLECYHYTIEQCCGTKLRIKTYFQNFFNNFSCPVNRNHIGHNNASLYMNNGL